MKKYAFIYYGGEVLGIETRCSCFHKSDKKAGELAIEDICHPEQVNCYVEIPEGVEVVEGMIYSDGTFKPNPSLEELAVKVAELEALMNAMTGGKTE